MSGVSALGKVEAARVALAAGEQRIVDFLIPLDALCWRDPVSHQWRIESGGHRVIVQIDPDTTVETTVYL